MPNTKSSLLLKKLESETLKNARLYSTVKPNKSQAVLLDKMKQYIDYNNYKTLFGDMVPLIMCNALNINLIVISKHNTGYDVMTVNTGDKLGGETILSPHVVLMKCDEHYDACMQCLYIDINNHTNFCEPRMLPAYRYLIPWKPPRQRCFCSGGKVMYYQQQFSVHLCEYSGGEWVYNIV